MPSIWPSDIHSDMLSASERNGIIGTVTVALLCLAAVFMARGCGAGRSDDSADAIRIDTIGHNNGRDADMADAAGSHTGDADDRDAVGKGKHRKHTDAKGKNRKKRKTKRKSGGVKGRNVRPPRVPLDEVIR